MEYIISKGITYIQLGDTGFAYLEDMSLMLEGAGLCWLMNWFVDIKKWGQG